jgi:hypothetical protein
MTKTNHLQTGLAYCYLKRQIVPVPGPHIADVCIGEKCPYMAGSVQGEGIECLWDDGTGRPLSYDDPFALEKLVAQRKVVKRSEGLGQ